MKVTANPLHVQLNRFFANDDLAQIIKITDGRFIAKINDETLVDIQGHKFESDVDTGEQTQMVWYVRLQIYPAFETITSEESQNERR